jgi:hypothetical protein
LAIFKKLPRIHATHSQYILNAEKQITVTRYSVSFSIARDMRQS